MVGTGRDMRSVVTSMSAGMSAQGTWTSEAHVGPARGVGRTRWTAGAHAAGVAVIVVVALGALGALGGCAGKRAPAAASELGDAGMADGARAAADAAGAAASAPAAAPATSQPLTIDLYGTEQLTLDALLAACGDELQALADGLGRGEQVEFAALEAHLLTLGDFAHAAIALVTYRKDGVTSQHLTVDFVERGDATRRMAFLPRPTGSYDDPDGLIAAWSAYEEAIDVVWSQATGPAPDAPCPALHCLPFHAHPDVAAAGEALAARAPAQHEALAAILRDDGDARRRAAAAYLLAYAPDDAWVVAQLTRATRDGESLVRNNAMRVLAEIAYRHPKVAIPLAPVIDALDFPETTDRNKAAAILDGLLARPGGDREREALRDEVLDRAGTILVAMLRLRQPNNHDFAYRILKAASGVDLGEHEPAAWQAWLDARRR